MSIKSALSAAAEAARKAAEAARKAAEAAAKAAAEAAQQQAAAAQAQQAQSQSMTPQQNPTQGDAFNAANKAPVDLAPRPTGEIPIPPAAHSPVPSSIDEMRKAFPALKDKPQEDVAKAKAAMEKLVSGTFAEKAAALGTLSKTFPEGTKQVLDKLGLKDNKLAKLATNEKALGALSTLADPKKSAADKAQAALVLAKNAGDTFAPKDLDGVLKKTLDGMPAAEKLIGAVSAWADPSKSGFDKAKATLGLASALKDFAGKAAPGLANDLRKLDGSFKAAAAAMTLVDPKASTQDKILAGAQLAAEIPDLKADLTKFRDVMKNAGVSGADEIAKGAATAAEVAVKGLDPRIASQLSSTQVDELKALATKLGPDKLEGALKGITDKNALGALTGQLSKLDDKAGKRLLQSIGGMEYGALEKTLKNPEMLEQLGKLATKLDDDSAKVLGKLAGSMDEAGLKTLLKFGDGASADAMKTGLKALSKADGKLVGKALGVLEGTLGKMGVKVTAEVAGKVMKSLAKAIPVAGAIPNVIDAAKYGKEAIALHGKQNDLGFLAGVGMQLNAADAVVGIVLDATGVGVAADVGVSVAFGAAELALDIGFDAEKAKYEADPQNYKAPDWVKAVNLAAAAAQGPAGVASLAAYYGPEGSAQLMQWGVEKGVKGAVDLAKFAGVTAAEVTGNNLKLAGAMMHAAADVIRNPSKYGEAIRKTAVDTFNTVIDKGGELANEAIATMKTVVSEAKAMGAKGMETLKWIAQNPGPVAKMAVDGIKSMISTGIDLTTRAGKELYKKGVETLEGLQKGWENLKGAARQKADELIQSAKQGLTAAVNKAVQAGKDGVELVTWAATHPGEVGKLAKDATLAALKRGGEIAQATWNSVKALGNKGLDLAEAGIKALKDAGAAGVETLKYVIQNPGEAASRVRDWAGQTLRDMVKAGGEAATKAAGAIKDFIDARADWAMKFGKELIRDGSKAFLDVARAWKDNLTEGGKAFMDGLKDLGSAGVNALQDLAKMGGQLADAAVSRLNSLAQAGIGVAKDALKTLSDFGGEVGRAAKSAYNTARDFTDGEFTVGGYKVDLNPFW